MSWSLLFGMSVVGESLPSSASVDDCILACFEYPYCLAACCEVFPDLSLSLLGKLPLALYLLLIDRLYPFDLR